MLRKLIMALATIGLVTLIVSGCGKKEDVVSEPNEEEENQEPEENEEPEEEEEEEEENEEREEDKDAHSGSFAELIALMEETVDGTANILYENNEQQIHESEGMSVSINGYTLVELLDFHTNYSIPFGDETEGGVIIAEYTVKNDTDEDAYLMPDFYIDYPNATRFHNDNRDLLPEDNQLKLKIAPSTDYLIKAGEEITGHFAYSFAPEHLEHILDLGLVTVNIPKPHNVEGDVNSNFGKEGKFNITLSGEGEEASEASKDFYEDKVTYDNMGEKIMIKEKGDIGLSEDLRDVTVTLDGYQFTEFIPNSAEAPRFSNFDTGMALLTVKFDLDNKGSDDIGLSSLMTTLYVNDGSQYLSNELSLMTYRNDDLIKAGESGEWLQVYLLDQEQYEKIWKDKSFEIKVGPMRDEEAKDISKGHEIKIELPN